MIRLIAVVQTAILLSCVGPVIAQDMLPPGLGEIAAAKRFVIGWRPERRPMSWQSKSAAEPDGFAVALCRHVAKAVRERIRSAHGVEIEIAFRDVTAAKDERFKALEEGRIDILCGTTTRTLSRAERFDIDFTLPIFLTGGVFVSSNTRGPRVRSLDDLRGLTLAVLPKTTTEAVLKPAVDRQGDVKLVYVESLSDGFACLTKPSCEVRRQDGQFVAMEVHALAGDQLTLLMEVRAAGLSERLWVSRDFFSFEPYALAVSSRRRDLRLMTDRVLSRLYRGDGIEALLTTYIAPVRGHVPQSLIDFYGLIAIPE